VIAQGSGVLCRSTLASMILRPTGRNDLMEKPSAAVTMKPWPPCWQKNVPFSPRNASAKSGC